MASKGAAEEPSEPEPGESSYSATSSTTAPAAAAAASYDPREYQVHPDDRGGGGGKPAKKGKGKGKTKAKGGAEGKGTDKADEDDGTHSCGNCNAPDAKSKCKGCGVEYYCNRKCQKVRTRVEAIGGRVRTGVGAARA